MSRQQDPADLRTAAGPGDSETAGWRRRGGVRDPDDGLGALRRQAREALAPILPVA